jgi:ribokinase
MTVLNLGSLNIDRVFRVGHIARPGETIGSTGVQIFAGGKGANQSVALARAGAQVAHAGQIGPDGIWLLEKLNAENVDTRRIRVGDSPTGQAIIQVDEAGQNAIILFGGANHEMAPADVDQMLAGFGSGDWLLLQNETSSIGHAIERAKQRSLHVAFNPAPFDARVADYPWHLADLLCVNEVEGAAMTEETVPDQIVAALAKKLPRGEILLTLGAAGVLYRGPAGEFRVPAPAVQAVDTTAAGDTFLGYFLAGISQQLAVRENLERACRAAALCVTRPGAIDAIPRLAEVVGYG